MHPCSPIFIHFHPFSSTLTHFRAFSSTFRTGHFPTQRTLRNRHIQNVMSQSQNFFSLIKIWTRKKSLSHSENIVTLSKKLKPLVDIAGLDFKFRLCMVHELKLFLTLFCSTFYQEFSMIRSIERVQNLVCLSPADMIDHYSIETSFTVQKTSVQDNFCHCVYIIHCIILKVESAC